MSKIYDATYIINEPGRHLCQVQTQSIFVLHEYQHSLLQRKKERERQEADRIVQLSSIILLQIIRKRKSRDPEQYHFPLIYVFCFLQSLYLSE